MNKVYKVIWSQALSRFTVVSETAKSKGKTKSQRTSGVTSSSSCGFNSLTRAMLLMGGLVASNIALASSDVIGADNQVSGVDPSKVQIVGDRNNLALAITSPNTQDLLREIQISGNDNAILSVLHGVSVVGDANVVGEKDNPYAAYSNWASYFDFNSNVNIFGSSNALNSSFKDLSILGGKNELSGVGNLSVVGGSNKVDKVYNSVVVGNKNAIGNLSEKINVVGSENKVSYFRSAPSKDASILGNENTIQVGLAGVISGIDGGSVVGNRNRVGLENVNVLGSDNTVSTSKPSYAVSGTLLYLSSGSVIGDRNQVNTQAYSVDNTNTRNPVTNKVMGNSNIISGSENQLVGSSNTLGTKLATKVSENQLNKTSYNENIDVDITDILVRDSVYQNNVVGSSNLIFSDSNEVFGSQNTIAAPISKSGNNNTVIGSYNKVYSNSAILLGESNELGKPNGDISGSSASVLLGRGNKLWGDTNNVLGMNQYVVGTNNIAIGSTNTVGVVYSNRPSLGLADILPSNSIVIGRENANIANNAVVIGSHIQNKYDNNVILGSFSEDAKAAPVITKDGIAFAGGNPVGVVSVGAKDKERQIKNVAAGQISAESTDAVNGSQIFALTKGGGASGGNLQYIGIKGNSWESNKTGEGAMGVRSIAIGAGARAIGNQASSIGQFNTAGGSNSYTYGNNNNVRASDSTVLGIRNTTASNLEIGYRNPEIIPARLGGTIANNNILGNYNNTDGSNIIVIGNNNSSGNSSLPIPEPERFAVANDGANEVFVGAEAGSEFPKPFPTFRTGNDFNTIIGDKNQLIGFSNRVMGVHNQLYAQYSSVEGDDNIVGDPNGNKSMLLTRNVRVDGSNNKVVAINTVVEGDRNNINHAVNSIVNGSSNLLLNTNDYLQKLSNTNTGDNNSPVIIDGNMALGNKNIIVNSNETVALGHENSLVGENLYVIGSRNQQAFRTQNANLFSPVSDASLSTNSNIVGSENILSNLLLSNLVGYGNKIDAENTSVIGNSNTSNLVNHTVILGNQNHQATGSSLTASVGDNNMSSGSQIGIMGYGNTVGFDNTMDFKVANLTGLGIDIDDGSGIDIYGSPIASENPLFPNVQKLPSMKVYETFVTGSENTVLSDQSVVMGTKNILMQKDENTASKSNIVIGGENKLKGDTNVVIGQSSGIAGNQSIAIGISNVVTGNDSGAFGYPNIVKGTGSYAFGNNNTITADNTFVLGNNVNTTQANSVILGNNSTDSAAVAVAGANIRGTDYTFAGTSPAGVVSVGSVGDERQIQNVAAGQLSSTSTDAVNGSQLFATNQAIENLIATGAEPLAVKYDSTTKDKVTLAGASGTKLTNVKAGTIATGSTDAVNGGQIATIANNSTAVMGGNAVTNNDGTMTVSNIGGTGESTIDGAVGVAYNTAKKAKTTVTQGKNIVVTPSVNADGSSNYTVATADDLVANSITTDKSVTGSVVIDKSVIDANGNTLINGVGAGSIASGSTQAINGDQIFNLTKAASNNFGGGSVVNADGTISAPTYTVTNNSYNNVGDAITALDQADTLNVKYDSATKDAITLAGASGTKLTNVKAGTIATGSTDAVNGGQIATIANNSTAVMGGNAVTNNDGTMTVSNIGGTGESTIDDAIEAAYKEGKAKTTVSQGENIIVSKTANNDGSINYNVATARDVDFNSMTTRNAVMGNTVIINNIKVDRNGNSVISGVGAGLVAKNSTEAINGDQLYDAIKNTSNSLGGGSTVNANGNMTNPSYNINGGTYNNVGDALTALDNKIVNGTDPLAVKYDATDKSTITLAGENGTKVTNVKDGVISATSTDAITGKQLNQTVQDTAAHLGGGSTVTVDGRITAPSYTVDKSSYNNVGDAISALDNKNAQQDKSIEQNAQAIVQTNNRITNEVSRIDQTNNRQDQLLETHTQEIEDLKNADKYNVKYNKDFSQVALIGKDGTGITNLKAGDISSTSTDAINGAQISKISQNSKDVMGGNAVTNVDGTMTVSNIGGTGQDTIDAAINTAYTAAQRAKSTVSAGKNIVVNKSLNSDGSTDYNVATADDVSLNSITTNNSKMGTVTVDQNVFDDRGNSIINGVGAGAIKQGSTQAINGDQLFNVSKSVASSLGGGAAVHSNGSITNPTYTVSNTNYNNVGDAIAAINANDKNNVKYNADKSRVDLQGKDGTVIGNVKNGEVSATSKEAINGSQLKEATDYIAKTFGGGVSLNGEYVAPTFTVDQQNYSDVATAFSAIEQRSAQLESNAYAYTNAKVNDLEQTLSAGIAATAALEQAPFVSGKWTYAVGSAYYNGQGAAGATIRKTSDNGRWSFTGGVAAGTQNTKPLVRMGVSGVF